MNFNKKSQVKLLDVFNLLLLAFFGFFVFSRISPSVSTFKDYVPQPTPKETPPVWGRNREFPADFSEEEKTVLTEQLHDYERVTPEMDDAYQGFLDLFKTYVSYDATISIIKFKDDCFARPVILGIRDGEAVEIVNNNDTWASMGVGGESWDIPPFGKLTVYPKLAEVVANQFFWGYACGEKGMAGYFVKEN